MNSIIVSVENYTATLGGWIRLSFLNVAGDAGLIKVELTSSHVGGMLLVKPAAYHAALDSATQAASVCCMMLTATQWLRCHAQSSLCLQ